MIPKIGISETNLQKNTARLSIILADEMTLYVKTRKFHWNITGESFMELHKLFQLQYTELEAIIDEVAERINKLGERTIGTMHEFLQQTRIKEQPGQYPTQGTMLSELNTDHETLIAQLRMDIDLSQNESHDAGTADLLTKILQQHETIAWVLRRYLS
jgi:starvation-inducible DNA-binding protein